MTHVRFQDAHLASFKAVDEKPDGSLVIRGIGANYSLDREDEMFVDGAFRKGLSRYLSGGAVLCYHHKLDTAIGRVIDAKEVKGKGVEITAVVDFQPEGSPWAHIFRGVKAGRISSFSVGGIFKKDGNKIVDVDILEWSVTPVPVGKGTDFSIIAGKALTQNMDKNEELEALRSQVQTMTKSLAEMKTGLPAGFAVAPKKMTAEDRRVVQSSSGSYVGVQENAVGHGLSELEKHAVEAAWAKKRTRLQALRDEAEVKAESLGAVMLPSQPLPLAAPASFYREEGKQTILELRKDAPIPTDQLGRAVMDVSQLTADQQRELDESGPNRPTVLAKIKAALMAQQSSGGVVHKGDTGVARTARLDGNPVNEWQAREPVAEMSPEEYFATQATPEEEK